MTIFNDPAWQSTKEDGSLNSNGKIYFREPGAGSTTLKTAYSDVALTQDLTNPVILGLDGRPDTEIWLDGDYNIQITDSAGVQITRVNNYNPPATDSQFDDWNALFPYDVEDFARGSDGKYYQSLSSGNLNNDPTTSDDKWVEKFFQDVWNQNKTYPKDDIVKYEDSMYVSLQASNKGNTPDATASEFWRSFFEPLIVTNYTAAGFEYRNTDGYNTTAFNTSVSVAASSFESVGPTGSGADNIWTAMDDIPESAKFVIISINVFYSRVGTTDDLLSAFVQARTTGGSAAIGFCQVGQWSDYGGAASNDAYISGTVEATIPLDSERRFDIRYSVSNDTGGSGISTQLVGYKL